MNNFGRTVLAVGLSAVMTFTNSEYFFQEGTGTVSVYAAEEKSAQGRVAEERTAANGSGEGESTTEVTTQKKEETTTESRENQDSSEKDTGSEKSDEQTKSTEDDTDNSTNGTGHTDSSGNAEHTDGTSTGTAKKNHTSDSSESSTSESTESNNGSNSGNNGQSDTQNAISSREEAELRVKTVKNIKNQLAEEAAPDGTDKTSTFIPKIYNDTRLAMKNNKEYIAGYVYFNQTDSAWNQNGYCIAKAGCGPTSMAVVITSLTGKWVTPLDTAIWGYQHGFYSRAGSAHEMIPAMAAAYGLKCQGVGTDYNAIKKALRAGKPVVCLMGPGYFTRGGHFMVLVAIDKNDCVTVADVGSRTRSAYKYRLSDVIAQSKGASAGGPFWVMTYDKASKAALREKQAIKDYTQEDFAEDFADVSYMKVTGDLPETLKEEKKDVSVKKVVSILKMSTGKSFFDVVGAGKGTAVGTGSTGSNILAPVSKNSQVVVNTGSDQNSADKKSRNLALTMKQDIARRQWEKKIDMTWMDCYLKGTIQK